MLPAPAVKAAPLLLLLACSAPRLYGALPQGDRGAFEACASFVSQRACGQHGDSVVRQFCLADVAERYAALPPDSRRAFLVEAGCPSSIAATGR